MSECVILSNMRQLLRLVVIILHFLDVIDGNKHKTKQNEPNLLFFLEKQ